MPTPWFLYSMEAYFYSHVRNELQFTKYYVLYGSSKIWKIPCFLSHVRNVFCITILYKYIDLYGSSKILKITCLLSHVRNVFCVTILVVPIILWKLKNTVRTWKLSVFLGTCTMSCEVLSNISAMNVYECWIRIRSNPSGSTALHYIVDRKHFVISAFNRSEESYWFYRTTKQH